jgi:ribosomal protein S17E
MEIYWDPFLEKTWYNQKKFVSLIQTYSKKINNKIYEHTTNLLQLQDI